MRFVRVLASAVLTLTASVASAEGRLGLGEWNAFKPYQVTGVLSSNQILVLQADVYFTCQLDDQGSFTDLSPCQPVLTLGQRYFFAEQEVAAEKAYQDGLKAEAQRVKDDEAKAQERAKTISEMPQVNALSIKNAIISIGKDDRCIITLNGPTFNGILWRLSVDGAKLDKNQNKYVKELINDTFTKMIWSGEISYLADGSAGKKITDCKLPDSNPSTINTSEADQAAIDSALSDATAPDTATTKPESIKSGLDETRGQTLDAALNSDEANHLRQVIGPFWNIGSLTTEATRMTVTVHLEISEDQKVLSVEMVEFAGGTAEAAQQSFEAAKRAVYRAASHGLGLDTDNYESWRSLLITFETSQGKIR